MCVYLKCVHIQCPKFLLKLGSRSSDVRLRFWSVLWIISMLVYLSKWSRQSLILKVKACFLPLVIVEHLRMKGSLSWMLLFASSKKEFTVTISPLPHFLFNSMTDFAENGFFLVGWLDLWTEALCSMFQSKSKHRNSATLHLLTVLHKEGGKNHGWLHGVLRLFLAARHLCLYKEVLCTTEWQAALYWIRHGNAAHLEVMGADWMHIKWQGTHKRWLFQLDNLISKYLFHHNGFHNIWDPSSIDQIKLYPRPSPPCHLRRFKWWVECLCPFWALTCEQCHTWPHVTGCTKLF